MRVEHHRFGNQGSVIILCRCIAFCLSCGFAAFSSLTVQAASEDNADSFRGKIILFGVQRPKEAISGILAMDSDGTGQETVLEPTEGAWVVGGRVAPNGQRIAYGLIPKGSRQSEVWLLGKDGRRRKVADDGMVVAWSPDGAKLLCYRGKRDDFKSFLLDVTTQGEEQLDLPKADYPEDLSPDGRLMAVVDGNAGHVFKHPDTTKGTYPLRKIYLLEMGTRRTRQVMPGPMQDTIGARFSPDGSMIAYTQRRYRDRQPDTLEHSTMVMRSDGASPQEVVGYEALKREGDYESFRFAASPCWSPDGKSVLTLADKTKWELTGRADMEKVHKWTFELVFGSPERSLERRLDLENKGIVSVNSIDRR